MRWHCGDVMAYVHDMGCSLSQTDRTEKSCKLIRPEGSYSRLHLHT